MTTQFAIAGGFVLLAAAVAFAASREPTGRWQVGGTGSEFVRIDTVSGAMQACWTDYHLGSESERWITCTEWKSPG
jgi:hypothetical protein